MHASMPASERHRMRSFALAPLTDYSQDAPAPEIHDIVIANMDRSVKPGDDSYYLENSWAHGFSRGT